VTEAPTPTPAEESPEATGAGLLQRALRSAGSDAARYIPVRFVPALTSLITVPVFTAAISKADYGAFYLVSSVAALFSAVATGWISSSAMRFYWPFKLKNRLDAFTSTVLWTATTTLISTGILMAGIAFFLRDRLSPEVAHLVPAALAYYFFNFLTNVLVQVLRAANRASAFARMQIMGTLLTTGLSIAFVWWGHWGAAGILGGVAIGWAITLIPMLREIAKEGSVSPRDIDEPLLREFLSFGMPMVPVGLATWALVLLDRFVINRFQGAAAVGLYSVMYALGEKIMQLVTIPLLLTMSPSLTEAFERRGQHLAERVQTQFVRYFALVTFPLLAGMTVAAQPFVRIFVSPEYADAWRVLPIIAAGSMLASFSQIAGTGLGLHKKTKLIMLNTIGAASLNLGANMLLVPRFGYLAAACNTLLAYGALLVLTAWQSRLYMRLTPPWNALGRILLATSGMAVAIYLVFGEMGRSASRAASIWVLLGEVLLGIVVYVVLLIAVKAIRPDERAFAREMGAKGIARLRRTPSE